MSQYISIGNQISFPALRDYIIANKFDTGDTILLNPGDFERLLHEIKAHGDEIPDIPVNMLGVLITQDSSGDVPTGKIQIVKNEQQF